jgi:toxin ParE1/3/4
VVRYTRSAQLDLRVIRDYGDDVWGQARSDDFLEALITSIERLDDHPLLGRARDAFLPGLRSIQFRTYIVFYLIKDVSVTVIAILHERRNHAALDFSEVLEGDL